jgi:hypothetical protein
MAALQDGGGGGGGGGFGQRGGMFLHVRATYPTLARHDALMLHVHPDVGSTWQITPVGDAAPGWYLITSSRATSDGNPDCNLHVRKSWEKQNEEDMLILCHHGHGTTADDKGSHWSVEHQPDGTYQLRNSRSGRYLAVRQNWATEPNPKGSHLALSQDPTTHNAVWCFEGDHREALLRSPSANIERTPLNANKFLADGTPAPYFGLTTVCALPPTESLYDVMRSIQDSLSADPDLKPYYSLLPPSSFHMTVFDIISGTDFEEVRCLRRIIILV